MSQEVRHRWSMRRWFGQSLVHLTGVSTLAVTSAFLVFDRSAMAMALRLHRDASFEPNWVPILLHAGLAACAWTLCVIAWHWARQNRSQRKRSIIRLSRGTVMTETLIVIVPFLLLTSGLAQLAILNATTLLAHYAAFQSARAAWVWIPEQTRPGRTSSMPEIEDRVRLAAAMALAPSAPADFVTDDVAYEGLRDARAAMAAYFTPGEIPGSSVTPSVDGGIADGRHSSLIFNVALDQETFRDRAARKLTFAYLATEVDVTDGGNQVGVDLSYQMNIVFPWFAYIWGDYTTIGGRAGYYLELNRGYTMEAQVLMD